MPLEIVSLKNNLLLDWKTQEAKSQIITRINELKINNPNYKTDNEFLVLVCNLIEYLIVKKDKIDKKQICVSVYKDLFGLTPEDEESLKRNIDFIHANKSTKKVSKWKLFKDGFNEYVTAKKG